MLQRENRGAYDLKIHTFHEVLFARVWQNSCWSRRILAKQLKLLRPIGRLNPETHAHQSYGFIVAALGFF